VTDWMTGIFQKMFSTMQRNMAKAMREAMQEAMGELASPEKLMEMLKAMGIDISQLTSQIGASQMPSFDPYKVLGLDRSASDEQIKKRYHDLLRKLHPDTSGIEGTEFLTQIVIGAYEMIRRERGWR